MMGLLTNTEAAIWTNAPAVNHQFEKPKMMKYGINATTGRVDVIIWYGDRCKDGWNCFKKVWNVASSIIFITFCSDPAMKDSVSALAKFSTRIRISVKALVIDLFLPFKKQSLHAQEHPCLCVQDFHISSRAVYSDPLSIFNQLGRIFHAYDRRQTILPGDDGAMGHHPAYFRQIETNSDVQLGSVKAVTRISSSSMLASSSFKTIRARPSAVPDDTGTPINASLGISLVSYSPVMISPSEVITRGGVNCSKPSYSPLRCGMRRGSSRPVLATLRISSKKR